MARLLVTGAGGVLGTAVLAAARPTDWEVTPTTRRSQPGWATLELTEPASIDDAVRAARPDAVLHLAAVTAPVAAERDPDATMRVNRDGSGALARACRAAGARLCALSSDLVFAGRAGGMYREDDQPAPLSVYGRSKLEAERAVLEALPGALVIRTSLLLAPGVGHVAALERGLAGNPGPSLFVDEWRSPVLAADLARALLDLLAGDHRGVLHVAGPERLTRFELGARLATALGRDPSRIRRAERAAAPPPPRPGDASLDSARAYALLGYSLRTVDNLVS